MNSHCILYDLCIVFVAENKIINEPVISSPDLLNHAFLDFDAVSIQKGSCSLFF